MNISLNTLVIIFKTDEKYILLKYLVTFVSFLCSLCIDNTIFILFLRVSILFLLLTLLQTLFWRQNFVELNSKNNNKKQRENFKSIKILNLCKTSKCISVMSCL